MYMNSTVFLKWPDCIFKVTTNIVVYPHSGNIVQCSGWWMSWTNFYKTPLLDAHRRSTHKLSFNTNCLQYVSINPNFSQLFMILLATDTNWWRLLSHKEPQIICLPHDLPTDRLLPRHMRIVKPNSPFLQACHSQCCYCIWPFLEPVIPSVATAVGHS